MTRARLILALAVSIILVGGAGWMRFSAASAVKVENLAAVGGQDVMQANAEKVADIISEPSPEASSTPQTDTSLISQQLFGDFFSLVSNGQVTDENVQALASNYADSVSKIDKASRISPADLNVVKDSVDSFNTYLLSIDSIYDKYKDLVSAQSASEKDLSRLGPDFTAWAESMESLYEREVAELKAVTVPASLLEDHAKLVNNYLSNESAMHSMTMAESDPASALGAIVTHEKNVEEEKAILTDMQNILMKNGIISSNP